MSGVLKMIRTNFDLLHFVEKLYLNTVPPEPELIVYAKGEKVLIQGKRNFHVHVLKSGMAKCFRTEDNGKDFIQEFFGPGEIFGEVEVIKNNPSFCSVEALTPLEVFRLTKSDFEILIARDSNFRNHILGALATKISYKAPRHAFHQSHSLQENLQNLLSANPDILKILSKNDLANYLGITVRSLNRVLDPLSPLKPNS